MKYKKTKIVLSMGVLLFVAFGLFIATELYKELSKKEQDRKEQFYLYTMAWAVNQHECDKVSGKTDFILSLIKDFSAMDEMQIQSRLKKRNDLVAREKAGTITAGERLELSERQPDIREYPVPLKLYDLFLPSKFNAVSMPIPYTQIGTSVPYGDDFMIVYDDGYTRWQADEKHWNYFISLKYRKLKDSGTLDKVIEKLIAYDTARNGVFDQAKEDILAMPKRQLSDYFVKLSGEGVVFVPEITIKEFQDFLFSPERLSQDRQIGITVALARPLYLEQRCQGDYRLLPEDLLGQ